VTLSAQLVIRPERLGDLVIATPALRALKENFPDRPLHVLTDHSFAEVLRHDPHVDKIIPIHWRGRRSSQRDSFLHILGLLRKGKYHSAYILYAGWDGWSWLLKMAGVPNVTQLGGTKSALLFGHKMILRKGHHDTKHYVDWYLEVVRSHGACSQDRIPKLYLTDSERTSFLQKFPDWKERKTRVIVHPFKPGSAPHFGIDGYQKLVRALLKMDLGVIISGTKQDAATWLPIDGTNNDILGTVSVREFMCATEIADLLIADSTGVIHVAAGLGTKTLGFYCPSIGAGPALWGPISTAPSICLTPDPNYCSALTHDASCCLNGACQLEKGIPIQSIISSIKSLLDLENSPRPLPTRSDS